MKVVVVEDEILIREGLCELMRKMFPELVIAGVAGNGREGLSCIEKEQPDLVITDISMPGMSGITLVEQLKQKNLKSNTLTQFNLKTLI